MREYIAQCVTDNITDYYAIISLISCERVDSLTLIRSLNSLTVSSFVILILVLSFNP